MVKKILQGGEPCNKCSQAEEILKKRGYWDRIDSVVYIKDDEDNSRGVELARKHKIKVAPFFVVDEKGEEPRVYTRVFEFINRELSGVNNLSPQSLENPQPKSPGSQVKENIQAEINDGFGVRTPTAGGIHVADVESIRLEYSKLAPPEILAHAQGIFGKKLALAFSGAEDVILIDMASRNNMPFSVFCLDTGRLHPETYTFIEEVRNYYGLTLEVFTPSPILLQPFLRVKGINSFYQNGHAECCGIRKVEPLSRALKNYKAWVTGLRRDQSPATREHLKHIGIDSRNTDLSEEPLIKINPLLNWSSKQVWDYIRSNKLPYNSLHDVGYQSIGCQPCTRPLRPGEHERAARWWWEDETKRECGINI